MKHFYLYHVQKHLQKEFTKTVSYNRFTELQRKTIVPLAVFIKVICLGKCTDISLRICHIKNGRSNTKPLKTWLPKGDIPSVGCISYEIDLIINNDKG
ncbi:MAG: hypothetical protein PW786_02925 [Arachidicoccus sp.]|nr:hypothetical protein [Arachidicoccus sp.]